MLLDENVCNLSEGSHPDGRANTPWHVAIYIRAQVQPMRHYECPVWLISTPLGDVLRTTDEVEDVDTAQVRLRQPCLAIPEASAGFPRSSLQCMMLSKADLPDLSRVESKVCNVCGFVAGPCRLAPHASWKTMRSALGHFSEAYTLRAGNLLFLHDKLIFKGATDRDGVYSTVRRLTLSPETPTLRAYLIVVSAFLRKNLYVHQCCLLEEMLSRVPWCRVMQRHDEMSNAVLFYINDWSFLLGEAHSLPDMCMVSVSRRGVMNVRLGWHKGVDWTGNAKWIALVDRVRDFVGTLC